MLLGLSCPLCHTDDVPRGCAIPCISSRVQDGLLRTLHAHLSASRAAPQAGATTRKSTILLQVILCKVTHLELEGGCPSLRASGNEYWGIKLVLKWCHAISKGCNASQAVQGRTWCTGFKGFEA